jgi:hypothetical protein
MVMNVVIVLRELEGDSNTQLITSFCGDHDSGNGDGVVVP